MKSPEVLFLAGEAELGDRVDAGDEDLLNWLFAISVDVEIREFVTYCGFDGSGKPLMCEDWIGAVGWSLSPGEEATMPGMPS
jgi:hypothetical protein